MTLKAKIYPNVHCPRCYFIMTNVNDEYIECPNRRCVLHGQRYEVPWLPLIPFESSTRPVSARPGLSEPALEALKALIDELREMLNDANDPPQPR